MGRESVGAQPPGDAMNIGQAKTVYKDHGDEIFRDEHNLIERYRKNKWMHALSNDSYVHALALSATMFRETKRSLCMFTSPTADDFLECLYDDFRAALNRIAQAPKGSARMILFGTGSKEAASRLQNAFNGTLAVQAAVPVNGGAKKLGHFVVCDDCMVRLEKPHDDLVDTDDASVVQAIVYPYNPGIARIMRRRFNRMWKRLSKTDSTPGVCAWLRAGASSFLLRLLHGLS